MPDYAMCSGEGCPMKEKCKRYRSFPSDRQSYFMKPPFKQENCELFINFEDRNGKQSADAKDYSPSPNVNLLYMYGK